MLLENSIHNLAKLLDDLRVYIVKSQESCAIGYGQFSERLFRVLFLTNKQVFVIREYPPANQPVLPRKLLLVSPPHFDPVLVKVHFVLVGVQALPYELHLFVAYVS